MGNGEMDDMSDGKSAYLSDYWTTDDYLSFSDFRPALYNIITTAQTPLTVGVFGPWGSGKTSLLRMLKQEIDEKGLPSLRTVWFTAKNRPSPLPFSPAPPPRNG